MWTKIEIFWTTYHLFLSTYLVIECPPMAKRKFLGPKSKRLEKKKKILKALGASVYVNNFRYQWWWMDTLEIELFYSMPNLLLEKEISPLLKSSNLVESIKKINWNVDIINWIKYVIAFTWLLLNRYYVPVYCTGAPLGMGTGPYQFLAAS